MTRIAFLLPAVMLAGVAAHPAAAESVMVQCGREYQAARTAGTLNGMDWGRYRTDCAARLKAASASPAASLAAGAAPAPLPAAPAPAVAAAAAAAPPPPATAAVASGGMAAMHVRQKQCGAEWTAQKAALVAQTPGLTWPHYWSLCNTRLKAAGR